MNKNEQKIVNDIVTNEKARAELELVNFCNVTRLRTCQAYVYETTNYYWLKSYGTFVAFIDKTTDTCYDILRMVYGYTATSSQHIAKFRHDYGQEKFGCHQFYMYKEV